MAKAKTMMSPKGVAVYPRLKTPDTKYNELGEYKVGLAIAEDEAKDLISKLQEIHKAWTGKAAPKSKNPMFKKETDEEGEETGRYIFNFKVKNRMTKKGDLWERQPLVFDAKGKRIVDIPNIGGGSVLKVYFEIYEWQNTDGKGVSLQPMKIQLIDLKEYVGSDDSPFEEEDGFTLEEDEDDNPFESEEEDDNDDF